MHMLVFNLRYEDVSKKLILNSNFKYLIEYECLVYGEQKPSNWIKFPQTFGD